MPHGGRIEIATGGVGLETLDRRRRRRRHALRDADRHRHRHGNRRGNAERASSSRSSRRRRAEGNRPRSRDGLWDRRQCRGLDQRRLRPGCGLDFHRLPPRGESTSAVRFPLPIPLPPTVARHRCVCCSSRTGASFASLSRDSSRVSATRGDGTDVRTGARALRRAREVLRPSDHRCVDARNRRLAAGQPATRATARPTGRPHFRFYRRRCANFDTEAPTAFLQKPFTIEDLAAKMQLVATHTTGRRRSRIVTSYVNCAQSGRWSEMWKRRRQGTT